MMNKNTEKKRLWRAKNKLRDCYHNLKSNAKRRHHSFSLTFSEFCQFCKETDYIAGKGKHKDSYSIDRIDNEKGYEVSNVATATLSQNSKMFTKKTKQIKYEWQTREFFVIELMDSKDNIHTIGNDCPF